jgi:hypothetical protein
MTRSQHPRRTSPTAGADGTVGSMGLAISGVELEASSVDLDGQLTPKKVAVNRRIAVRNTVERHANG